MKTKTQKHWFEKFYDFMSNFIFGGKRTVLALIILISLNIHGQEKIILNDTCGSNLISLSGIENLKITHSFFREPLYEIKQSETKYFTEYKITVYKINYYTNVFNVTNGNIYFNEYNRDGSFKNGYEFPISKVKIYKSK